MQSIREREPRLVADELAQLSWLEARLARGLGQHDQALAALARMDAAVAEANEPHDLRARAATERVHWADPATRCDSIRRARDAWSAVDPSGLAWARQGINETDCRP
jgi:hypothetical protein